MIKVGIIGAGNISHLHIQGYIDNPNARVGFIQSHNLEHAKELALNLPYPVKTYDNFDQALLENDDCEMVEILTPHKLHESQVIACLEKGKHVSCQKVPTLTLVSMDKMIAAAKKFNKKLRIYENFRYYPPYLKAFELVKSGQLGKVTSVVYRMWTSANLKTNLKTPVSAMLWRLDPKEDTNVPTLFDDGYHKHSIIAWFLGDLENKITQVRAWSGNQKVLGIASLGTPAVIIYETENKTNFGTWTVSHPHNLLINSKYYACDEYLEIECEKGLIIVPGCTGEMFSKMAGIHWYDETGVWHEDLTIESDWRQSFINSTNDFIEEIINGKTMAQLTTQVARYILAIDLAVVESVNKNGVPVKVN